MKSAADYAKELRLESHPEGGYFRQTGASNQIVTSATGLQVPLYTNILFILEDTNPSNFHQIQSNEVWYFHEGNPLTVHCIYSNGKYEKIVLGRDVFNGQLLQYEVPKGVIFGSSVDSGFALVSCMVSPGFDFREFKLFSRKEMLIDFPQHEEIITKLTRD